MKIFENYNNASQKYGSNIVKELSNLGLPPKYLQAACKWKKENNIPPDFLVDKFRDWMTYVVRYQNIDVNQISFGDFLSLIAKGQRTHPFRNVIISTDNGSLGELTSAADVQKIPVKHHWCISSKQWFDRYIQQGYKFYVVYLPKEPLPYTYIAVGIMGGNLQYYDVNDNQQYENLNDTDNS